MTLLALEVRLEIRRLQWQDVPVLALGAPQGREVRPKLGRVQAAAALAREVLGLLQNDL